MLADERRSCFRSLSSAGFALGLLEHRFLFFTARVVVNLLMSTATAIALVQTPAARAAGGEHLTPPNLDDEMLGVPLSTSRCPCRCAGLEHAQHRPRQRRRGLPPARAGATGGHMATEDEARRCGEQLSGACTTEIAAFDEFAACWPGGADADHLRPCGVRTAPTGHTLRLLSLPKAWTGFWRGNDRGASCLGPHSGLKMQEARFNAVWRC